MQSLDNFYLCDEKEESIFATGTLKQVLQVAANKKLSGHVLNEFESSDGDRFPGQLIAITHCGKPYYLPLFNGTLAVC